MEFMRKKEKRVPGKNALEVETQQNFRNACCFGVSLRQKGTKTLTNFTFRELNSILWASAHTGDKTTALFATIKLFNNSIVIFKSATQSSILVLTISFIKLYIYLFWEASKLRVVFMALLWFRIRWVSMLKYLDQLHAKKTQYWSEIDRLSTLLKTDSSMVNLLMKQSMLLDVGVK